MKRTDEEIRKVAEYCERVVLYRLQPMDAWIDFYHGVQRGLSWALGDIDEAWADMMAEVERDIHPDDFFIEQFRKEKENA